MQEITVTDTKGQLTIWNENQSTWDNMYLDQEEYQQLAIERNTSEMEIICGERPIYWMDYKSKEINFRMPLEGIFEMDTWYPQHYFRRGDPWEHLFNALDENKKPYQCFTWALSQSDSDEHMHTLDIGSTSITFVAPQRIMFFTLTSPEFRKLFGEAMKKLHEYIVFIKQRMVQRYPDILETLEKVTESNYDADRRYRYN